MAVRRKKLLDRLNGWQRLGVLASVVWMLVGVYLANAEIERRNRVADAYYSACHEEAMRKLPLQPTINQSMNAFRSCSLNRVGGGEQFFLVGCYSLLPVPLGWIAVYALLKMLRWIKAGFEIAD